MGHSLPGSTLRRLLGEDNPIPFLFSPNLMWLQEVKAEVVVLDATGGLNGSVRVDRGEDHGDDDEEGRQMGEMAFNVKIIPAWGLEWNDTKP